VLQASSVPPLVTSPAAAPQPLEGDVAIAGVSERPLKRGDRHRVRTEPFECVAHAAYGAPQSVESVNVVRSAPQGMTPCDRPSGTPCGGPTSNVSWNRRHAAQCLDGTEKALASQSATQPPLGTRAPPPQASGPLRRRALLELDVDVADSRGLVAQPAEVVAQRVPSTQREPDAQASNRNADLVRGLGVVVVARRRSPTHQLPEAGP